MQNPYNLVSNSIPLLDTYTNSKLAFSLMLLNSSYSGDCIRVRRSSDDSEQDIGFSEGVLDTSSLTTFTGANDGFVTKWYDQSGNGNDVVQTTNAAQPRIVSGGVVDMNNGKPALYFNAAHWLQYPTTLQISDGGYLCICVGQQTTGGAHESFVDADNEQGFPYTGRVAQLLMIHLSSGLRTLAFTSDLTNFVDYNTMIIGSQILAVGECRSGFVETFVNGATNGATALIGSCKTDPSIFNIGAHFNGNNYKLRGYISEVIHFATDESSNRADMENDINSRYSIY